MVCPKCGAEVKEGYCLRCGMLVSGKLPTQMDDSVFRDKTNIEDVDELEIFVGNNADKIIYNPVNFAASFLGPWWFAYRKCYFLSIFIPLIWILIVLLVEHFLTLPGFIYSLAFFIFYLMFANKIYLYHAHRKIKKIKKKHMDYYALLKKKGGVTKLYAFLYPIFIITIFVASVFGFYRYSKSDFVVGNLRFFAWNYELDHSKKTLVSRKEDLSCQIYIMEMKKMDDTFYKLLETDTHFSDFKDEKIGNEIWKKKSLEKEEAPSVIYVYEKDSVYLARFSADNTKDYHLCQKDFEKVRKSFRFKKNTKS